MQLNLHRSFKKCVKLLLKLFSFYLKVVTLVPRMAELRTGNVWSKVTPKQRAISEIQTKTKVTLIYFLPQIGPSCTHWLVPEVTAMFTTVA